MIVLDEASLKEMMKPSKADFHTFAILSVGLFDCKYCDKYHNELVGISEDLEAKIRLEARNAEIKLFWYNITTVDVFHKFPFKIVGSPMSIILSNGKIVSGVVGGVGKMSSEMFKARFYKFVLNSISKYKGLP
jgi:hypothetical protein